MGTPEPIEPEKEESPSGESPSRADWLVGADEGLQAELDRKDGEAHHALPAPKLIRPGGGEAELAPPPPARERSAAPPARPGIPLRQPTDAGEPPPPKSPSRAFGRVQADSSGSDFEAGLPWTPPPSSVPSLRREPASRPQPAENARDFPMDDVDEHRPRPSGARSYATLPDDAFDAPGAPPAHSVVSPSAFDVSAPPLPFWAQIPHLLRTNRLLQGLTAFVIVAVLAVSFWPTESRLVSVARVRQNARSFDGRVVKVTGKTGEVFQVGGGYAYYLHQGRDTIVVFTRSHVPRERQNVAVIGMVSTGYLDGLARSAIFEQTTDK